MDLKRIFGFIYGGVAYAGFMLWMVYMIGFVGFFPVPKDVNTGESSSIIVALIINFLLIFAFAVQHTIMARPQFKKWWTQIIPEPLERSTFVLVADILAWCLVWQWRPIPGELWNIQNTLLANVLIVISLLGWLGVCLSSFMTCHFELLGLKQVWHYLRDTDITKNIFRRRGFYKLVRHPIMTGFLIFFWATPHMTASHLCLATLYTLYILIGIQFEEKDLIYFHPEEYQKYKREVPALIPFGSVPNE